MDDKTRNKRVSLHMDDNEVGDPSRRAALKAVGKYAAFLAGTSSAVLLSADDVLAKPKPCSWFDNKPGNGPPPGRPPKRGCS